MSSSKRPAEAVLFLEEPLQKSRRIYYKDSELINSVVTIVMRKKTPQDLQKLTDKLVELKNTVFEAVEGTLARCDDMGEEEDEEGESRKDKFLKRLFAAFDHRDAVEKWMHEGCDLSMKKLLNKQKVVVVGFFACRHLFPALLREIESKIDGFRGKEEDAEKLSELLNQVEGYSGDPLATFLEDRPLFRDEDFLREMAEAFSFEP